MLNFVLSLAQPMTNDCINKSRILPIPMQSVRGASPTHILCNRQALQILYNDKHTRVAEIFNHFAYQLDAGVLWADKGFKSAYHLYDVSTMSGKWPWPNGAQVCEKYYLKAKTFWEKKDHLKAMFYLGAATHIIQDMCVPHHARCVFMDGHLDYEKWVEARRENYCVYEDGIYLSFNSSQEWVHMNAVFASKYYGLVQAKSPEEDYHLATGILLPRSQRITSGFWLDFFYKVINK